MTDILGPASAPNAVTVRPTDTRTGFGATDTWFKDCTSATADDGTDIQAGWLNAIIAQIRTLVRGNGLTAGSAPIVPESNADDALALKAVQHLIQRAQPTYAVASGTGDAVTAALTPALAEYKAGLVVHLKIASPNTGTATLNLNGLGAKTIKDMSGANLKAGDLAAGQIATLVYDGTNFQLVSSARAAAAFAAGLATMVGDNQGVISDIVVNASAAYNNTVVGEVTIPAGHITAVVTGTVDITQSGSVTTQADIGVNIWGSDDGGTTWTRLEWIYVTKPTGTQIVGATRCALRNLDPTKAYKYRLVCEKSNATGVAIQPRGSLQVTAFRL